MPICSYAFIFDAKISPKINIGQSALQTARKKRIEPCDIKKHKPKEKLRIACKIIRAFSATDPVGIAQRGSDR